MLTTSLRRISFAILVAAGASHGTVNNLQVSTPAGTYVGLIDGSTPDVRQFRSVPFAQPPVGEFRWLPPVAVTTTNSSTVFDATRYPPSCPQYLASSPSLWTVLAPEWTIYSPGQNKTPGAYAHSSSEDCLYLAIWAPKAPKQKLPVILFMPGGAFAVGGVDVPYQIPAKWVQRTQSHIVVTMNYRLNVMGFPGAAGLDDKNVGLLDQRAAMEWLRSNIAAFGGDPNRITLWGQSAGAIATEFQSFIYTQDPIVSGYVMTSGSTGLGLATDDGTIFSKLAAKLGCGNTTSPAAEIKCMRQVPAEQLVVEASAFNFVPQRDEKTVFKNYTDLYLKGAFSQKPAVYSFCANDGVAVLAYPKDPKDFNATAAKSATAGAFNCPSAKAAALRSMFNKSVYRYEFAGNFSNVSPAAWLGAYHDADLAFIMGTYNDFRGKGPAYEDEVAVALQDKILAFAKNPTNVTDWPMSTSGRLLRFGAEDGPAVQVIPVVEVDAACLP